MLTPLLSLSAELCHVFCTSGGQIDWTYILAPKKIRVGLTFLEGCVDASAARCLARSRTNTVSATSRRWLAVSGWVCLVATASSLGATFIIQCVRLRYSRAGALLTPRQTLLAPG